MLAVGLFSHLDVADGGASLLNVSNLCCRVVRRAVEQGDRHHCWEIVGQSAGEEEIEAGVLIASSIVNVIFGMPGIDGRNAISSSLVVSIFRHFDEGAAGVERARSKLLNGIANAVADIVRSVFITSVGRLRHQDAQVARRNRRIGKPQSNCAALCIL